MNTTANNPRSYNPIDFTVVEHPMAVLVPALPVVGDAAAALEGMQKVDAIDSSVIEPVASESRKPEANDKDGLACNCGTCCGENWLLLIRLLLVMD